MTAPMFAEANLLDTLHPLQGSTPYCVVPSVFFLRIGLVGN